MKLSIALVLALAAASPAHAQFLQRPAIGFADAKAMAAACEDLAARSGWKTTFAVLDEGGRLLYFSRMDGADFNHGDMAINKAMTALVDGRPSSVTSDRIKAGETNVLSYPNYVAAGGGYPIFVTQHKVGAIGISGTVNFAQAEACATAALAAVKLPLPSSKPPPPPAPPAR